MAALTAKAALVDPGALGAEQAVTTQIPRAEIEEALRGDESPDLFIDVARAQDGEKHEVGPEQRITVSWEPADLEHLLSSTPGDEITFAFKPEELERLLEEPDVEAQGLREKAAVLTVAAATAAGIAAGAAGAQVATDAGAGGGGHATAPLVTDTTSSGPAATEQGTQFVTDTTSSGPAAETAGTNLVTDTTSSGPGPSTEGVTDSASAAARHEALGKLGEGSGTQFVTDATSSGPGATEQAGGTQFLTDATSSGPGATEQAGGTQFLTDATSSGPGATESGGTNLVTDTTSSGPGQSVEAAPAGGGESFLSSAGGEAALIGGIALLITGAGFLGTRHRGRVQPT